MKPTVTAAIDGFREAALVPALWPAALDRLAAAFDSTGATLVLGATSADSIAVSGSCAPFVSEYLRQIHSNVRERRVAVHPNQSFMPDSAYFSRREIARDPVYQEFLAPRGFGWNAVAALNSELAVSIKRSFRNAPYEGADLDALNAALPWLRSASATACAVWRSGFSGQLQAFESIGRGAIVLDRKLRVLEFNSCVSFGDGLDVQAGQLQASSVSERPLLHGFLTSLLSRPDSLSAPRCVLRLTRPSGLPPWLLEGSATRESLRSLHSHATVLLLVRDTGRPLRARPEALRQLFGFTPTESKLACELAAGQSLQEAAAHLGISPGHARQRLQVLFEKTGSTRQGELIALLARLA